MNESHIQLPLNYEELLNVEYEGEKIQGDRYRLCELKIIAECMLEGLKRDKRGYRSGNSYKDIVEKLAAIGCYRSLNAIKCQVARLALPITVLKEMAKFEAISPCPEKGIVRVVYRDCLSFKLELEKLGITKLTTGEYSPAQIDSPIIIRDYLVQENIDKLELIANTYVNLKLNLKTQAQWDEEIAKMNNNKN